MGTCRHQRYRGYEGKAWHPGHDLIPLLIMKVNADLDPLLANFVGIGKWCRNYFRGHNDQSTRRHRGQLIR